MTKTAFMRWIIGLFLLAGQPAYSAGSLPVALNQQVNSNGVPLVGCLLYLYVTGSVATPQLAYADTALTQPLVWPLVCDGNGRLPMFYVADGSIHPRLTDSTGVVQFDYPSMLVIGPSGGQSPGGTVDPTTVASTGDVKFRPTTEVLTGWVRLNGQTVGSATSGAVGRANADTQALFIYLWTNCPDATCPVSTGRGANALADFNANKTITLLDWRGRAPLGLDDMGGTAAGRLAGGLFATGNATTAQSVGGEAGHTLLQAELPVVTLNTAIASGQGSHLHSKPLGGSYAGAAGSGAGITYSAISAGNTDLATLPAMTGTTPLGGSATAINNLSPFMLGTFHIKL